MKTTTYERVLKYRDRYELTLARHVVEMLCAGINPLAHVPPGYTADWLISRAKVRRGHKAIARMELDRLEGYLREPTPDELLAFNEAVQAGKFNL